MEKSIQQTLKEKYGLDYDFEKMEDTTKRFENPSVWIAENTAQFIKLMLMNIPREFASQTEETKSMVKKVLANIFEVSHLILEGKMVYREKEFVSTFFEWIWQGIMDFLYGDGGLSIRKSDVVFKWETEEIEKAKPEAIRLLLQDMNGV